MSGARARHAALAHILVDKLKYCAYLPRMTHDADLDARGLLCPLPVLKARKRLQALASGQVLRVAADDPAAIVDVPHFCMEAGHSLIGTDDLGPYQVYLIRKA